MVSFTTVIGILLGYFTVLVTNFSRLCLNLLIIIIIDIP